MRELTDEQITLLDHYSELTRLTDEASIGLDGTAESLFKLSNVLAEQKVVAAQLAAAYRTVGIELDSLIGDTISSIRESVLSDEELFNLRQQEIADLTSDLSGTTDPGEIDRIAREVVRLTNEAFGLVDDTVRGQQASGFASFLERFDARVDDQLNAGLTQLGS